MKLTHLHILGQIGHDAKVFAIFIWKTLWTGFRKIVCAVSRIVLPFVPVFIVAVMAMGVVYCAGCVPAYMAYKNGQKESEQDSNTSIRHTQTFMQYMRKIGCDPVVYSEKINDFEEERHMGCKQ